MWDSVNDNIESISSMTIFILSYIVRVLIDHMTNWTMKTGGKLRAFSISIILKKKKKNYISDKIAAFSVFIFQFISRFILFIYFFLHILLDISHILSHCVFMVYKWIFILLDYYRCIKIKINSHRALWNIISKKNQAKLFTGYFKDKYKI